MDKKPPRPMTPFDELTMPAELQTLKLLLPYTPVSEQQFVWIFIKFIELQHTIRFFRASENRLHTQTFRHFPASWAEMFEEISPYLPPKEADMMNTLQNVMNIIEMMQMFQDHTDVSEDPSAENSADAGSHAPNSPANFGGMDPMNLMMGMLSPEQQEMFQMYQSMFSDMDSPGTDVPDGSSPGTDVPDGSSSGTDVPDGNSPGTDIPDGSSPGTDIPDGNTDSTERSGSKPAPDNIDPKKEREGNKYE